MERLGSIGNMAVVSCSVGVPGGTGLEEEGVTGVADRGEGEVGGTGDEPGEIPEIIAKHTCRKLRITVVN